MSRETVVIKVARCEAETKIAILCVMPDNEDGSTPQRSWIPRSQIADPDIRYDSYKGDEDFEIEIYKWFADREGLA